jgi:hypothetical protein
MIHFVMIFKKARKREFTRILKMAVAKWLEEIRTCADLKMSFENYRRIPENNRKFARITAAKE